MILPVSEALKVWFHKELERLKIICWVDTSWKLAANQIVPKLSLIQLLCSLGFPTDQRTELMECVWKIFKKSMDDMCHHISNTMIQGACTKISLFLTPFPWTFWSKFLCIYIYLILGERDDRRREWEREWERNKLDPVTVGLVSMDFVDSLEGFSPTKELVLQLKSEDACWQNTLFLDSLSSFFYGLQ